MSPNTLTDHARTAGSRGILHVVDSLERGGLERLVHDLAVAQQRRGHRVAVFSINQTGGFITELQAAGVPVIVGDKQGTLDLQVLQKLRQAVQEHRIDTVHAHNFVPSYYAAAALLGMRHRPSQVVTCHDMGTRLSNRRLRWLFKWSIRRSQGVAMVGKQVHDRFIRDGYVPAHKAMTLLNAVPVEDFGITAERRATARQALGLSADEVVVGCVGRLVELKNHLGLIRQWPDVLTRHPRARLVLIGEGPLRAQIEQLIADLGLGDRVMLAGIRSDVSQLLPGLDVFALPSFTEGVSIALLEACATGLPALASRVGGNVEVIQDGVTGRLFDVDDPSALRDALLQLVGDASLRESLGQRARQWVREHASMAALCTRYDRLYQDAQDAAQRR